MTGHHTGKVAGCRGAWRRARRGAIPVYPPAPMSCSGRAWCPTAPFGEIFLNVGSRNSEPVPLPARLIREGQTAGWDSPPYRGDGILLSECDLEF